MKPGPAAVVTVEREIKLVAPLAWDLPDLGGLLPGSTATTMPERLLDAVYYDTNDLRLARSGVTVRHRGGESGPAWTVKFPSADESGSVGSGGRKSGRGRGGGRGRERGGGGAAGSSLTRREIRVDGPADRVPDQVSDLVFALIRSKRLTAVARLTTTRVAVEIRGKDGALLAEVADDTVTATRKGKTVMSFREVEVELVAEEASGRDDRNGLISSDDRTARTERNARRVLRAAAERLIASGCEAEPPVPKLVRVLGEQATRPADVVMPPSGPDADVSDLVRQSTARSTAAILLHDPGVRIGDDPEDVHRFRVATRRLRSDLATFADLLDRDRATALRTELAWLGALVGPVRDTDVLAIRMREHGQALPDLDAPAVARLVEILAAQNATARAAMLAGLRSPRYRRLLDALVEAVAAPPLAEGYAVEGRTSGDAADRAPAGRSAVAESLTGDAGTDRSPAVIAAAAVRRPWRRLAKAVDALGPAPSDDALHDVRKLAKRCRYAAEAVVPIIGAPAADLAKAVTEVQTVLGDHQDTAVAEDWLRAAAETDPRVGVAAGQLIALERVLRADRRAQWPPTWHAASAAKLRRWL